MAEPSVLLAGGGTAGHVNPLLAVADALRAARPGVGLVALGTAEGLESRLVPEHGLALAVVPRVPLPRRPTLDWLRLPGRLRSAVRAASAAIACRDSQGWQLRNRSAASSGNAPAGEYRQAGSAGDVLAAAQAMAAGPALTAEEELAARRNGWRETP